MTSVMKISRVLAGVDFDDASASALKMAGALASAWEAEITVFHAPVLEVPAYFTGAQRVALQAERERSRAGIAARLHALADLIVWSVQSDAGPHSQVDAIVQMLKDCVHPVLFVPSADGMIERSS